MTALVPAADTAALEPLDCGGVCEEHAQIGRRLGYHVHTLEELDAS